jgi:hypothetical protein
MTIRHIPKVENEREAKRRILEENPHIAKDTLEFIRNGKRI